MIRASRSIMHYSIDMDHTTATRRVSDYDKVRILVVGDSGTGKTSLVHRLCHDNVLRNPRWTIGCSVDVKMHQYSKNGRNFFVEFWDVGGHRKYKHSRDIFYNQINGILLVFDLSNRKSYENMRAWISEIINADKDKGIEEKYMYQNDSSANTRIMNKSMSSSSSSSIASLPVLIVGNKHDLISEKRSFDTLKDFGLNSIFISSTEGDSQKDELHNFFDSVIERRYYRTSSRPHQAHNANIHPRFTSLQQNSNRNNTLGSSVSFGRARYYLDNNNNNTNNDNNDNSNTDNNRNRDGLTRQWESDSLHYSMSVDNIRSDNIMLTPLSNNNNNNIVNSHNNNMNMNTQIQSNEQTNDIRDVFQRNFPPELP